MSEMMCCPLSSGDYDGPSCSREKIVTARIEHSCCECGEAIKPGDKYEHVSGIWEGAPLRFRTCLSCAEIRDHFSCGNGFVFEQLWSDLQENFFPDMKAGGQCMEGLSPSAKGRLFEERLQWLFDSGREYEGGAPPGHPDWVPPRKPREQLEEPERARTVLFSPYGDDY